MTKRWLICLLISRSLLAVDSLSDIPKYKAAISASKLYVGQLEKTNALSTQQLKDCDEAKQNCENSHNDFLGITKTEWALLTGVTGFLLGFFAARRI